MNCCIKSSIALGSGTRHMRHMRQDKKKGDVREFEVAFVMMNLTFFLVFLKETERFNYS